MGEGDAEVEAPAFMPGEDVHFSAALTSIQIQLRLNRHQMTKIPNRNPTQARA